MLAPAPQAQRVRCRQIAQRDLGALAGLLAYGFPRTSHDGWTRGFARICAMPQVEGMPRFGYLLENENDIVGVLLLLSSRRGTRVIANLSSWYVEPNWRAHSTLLVAMATKQKKIIYLNASPAPHTWRTLQAQGFRPFNFGRSAVFPAFRLGGGHVSDIVPGDLPERELLRAHSAMGCLSLVCEKDGIVSPFIFKPRRLDRPPVQMMELIYCRSTQDFTRCGAALGRHLLKHGALGVILDGKIAGMPSHYAAGKEPRYFKGPEAPALNDLAFTEKVIFP
ncbi:MAG TPA: hypothetical protein VNW15_03705 [Rhizomicrobium sp.]|jgi:hypothetical protein|nr:hypothetical protein [Rhizomicrobium sp.]